MSICTLCIVELNWWILERKKEQILEMITKVRKYFIASSFLLFTEYYSVNRHENGRNVRMKTFRKLVNTKFEIN